MSMLNKTEKIFRYFGNDANPTLIAAGIALAKGIFRPIFTMMDKKQSADSKRYAATREGLTELIAIGAYGLSGILSKKLAVVLTRTRENLSKTDYPKKILENIISQNNIPAHISADKAKSIYKTFFNLKSTISMFGVFTCAFLVIPAVCSVAIKPIMNIINKQKTSDNNTQLNNITVHKPAVQNISRKPLNNILHGTYMVKSQGSGKVGSI